jgi:hypothetical protein
MMKDDEHIWGMRHLPNMFHFKHKDTGLGGACENKEEKEEVNSDGGGLRWRQLKETNREVKYEKRGRNNTTQRVLGDSFQQ